MEVLTVKQPWANFIVIGEKDVENRTWKCPEKYIGKRVLIHSSKTSNIVSKKDTNMLFGAIIGSVVIEKCVKDYNSKWAIKNHWHWVLKDAIKFDKPIMNVKGSLGIWRYDGYVPSVSR